MTNQPDDGRACYDREPILRNQNNTRPATYVVRVQYLTRGQTHYYLMISCPRDKDADARRLFGKNKYDKFTIVPKRDAPAWMVAEAEETMTNRRE